MDRVFGEIIRRKEIDHFQIRFAIVPFIPGNHVEYHPGHIPSDFIPGLPDPANGICITTGRFAFVNIWDGAGIEPAVFPGGINRDVTGPEVMGIRARSRRSPQLPPRFGPDMFTVPALTVIEFLFPVHRPPGVEQDHITGIIRVPVRFLEDIPCICGGGAVGIFGLGFAPAFWGFMAAVSEFFGGLLLALGLLSRFAAFFLFCTMVVATTMHISGGDGFNVFSHPLKLVFVFAGLVFTGPGNFSIDAGLSRSLKEGADNSPPAEE